MGLVQEMANSLVPSIAFTIDLPANYNSGKVQMLNTQVWTEPVAQGEGTKIRHTYFEKEDENLIFTSASAAASKTNLKATCRERFLFINFSLFPRKNL